MFLRTPTVIVWVVNVPATAGTANVTTTATSARNVAAIFIVRPSECLQCRLNFIDVAGDLHLVPGLADGAGLVDQEGRAVDAHVLAAVQALLDPGSVLLADLAVLVEDEREREFVLGLKLVVAADAV